MRSDCKTRIIVDTNLWISFLIGKKLAGLLDFLSDEKVELVVSQELLNEVLEVASRPKLRKISGITSKNGRNDAKRLNIRVVTVSNDDKPKNRKTQRKADLRRRMVCKSLPVKE